MKKDSEMQCSSLDLDYIAFVSELKRSKKEFTIMMIKNISNYELFEELKTLIRLLEFFRKLNIQNLDNDTLKDIKQEIFKVKEIINDYNKIKNVLTNNSEKTKNAMILEISLIVYHLRDLKTEILDKCYKDIYEKFKD